MNNDFNDIDNLSDISESEFNENIEINEINNIELDINLSEEEENLRNNDAEDKLKLEKVVLEENKERQIKDDEKMARRLQRVYNRENNLLENVINTLEDDRDNVNIPFLNTLNMLTDSLLNNTRNIRNIRRLRENVPTSTPYQENVLESEEIKDNFLSILTPNTSIQIIRPYNASNNFFSLMNQLFTTLNNETEERDSIPVVMNEKELNKLDIKKCKDIENKSEICVICLLKYKENDNIRLLPCHHDFHVKCIDKWLIEYNYKCPVCRKEVGSGHPIL